MTKVVSCMSCKFFNWTWLDFLILCILCQCIDCVMIKRWKTLVKDIYIWIHWARKTSVSLTHCFSLPCALFSGSFSLFFLFASAFLILPVTMTIIMMITVMIYPYLIISTVVLHRMPWLRLLLSLRLCLCLYFAFFRIFVSLHPPQSPIFPSVIRVTHNCHLLAWETHTRRNHSQWHQLTQYYTLFVSCFSFILTSFSFSLPLLSFRLAKPFFFLFLFLFGQFYSFLLLNSSTFLFFSSLYPHITVPVHTVYILTSHRIQLTIKSSPMWQVLKLQTKLLFLSFRSLFYSCLCFLQSRLSHSPSSSLSHAMLSTLPSLLPLPFLSARSSCLLPLHLAM